MLQVDQFQKIRQITMGQYEVVARPIDPSLNWAFYKSDANRETWYCGTQQFEKTTSGILQSLKF